MLCFLNVKRKFLMCHWEWGRKGRRKMLAKKEVMVAIEEFYLFSQVT